MWFGYISFPWYWFYVSNSDISLLRILFPATWLRKKLLLATDKISGNCLETWWPKLMLITMGSPWFMLGFSLFGGGSIDGDSHNLVGLWWKVLWKNGWFRATPPPFFFEETSISKGGLDAQLVICFTLVNLSSVLRALRRPWWLGGSDDFRVSDNRWNESSQQEKRCTIWRNPAGFLLPITSQDYVGLCWFTTNITEFMVCDGVCRCSF